MICDLKNGELPDINDIIMHKKLTAHFQPVVSVSRKMVIGIEGLIRGVDSSKNSLIPPSALFEAAYLEGSMLALDRICREKVIQEFGAVYKSRNDKLLFLNMDASILDTVSGSNYLTNQVKAHKIDPRNIVIEINETKVQDSAALKKFVDTYRKMGFMVALDDVGTGFSNMDRILLVKPDIIKIDMSIVRNIDTDYYKQGAFKSLVNLSNRIGTLVIAEGVETEAEATQILRLGGHMIQGYYFTKPQELSEDWDIFSNDKVEMLSRNFNRHMKKRIAHEREKDRKLNGIVNSSIRELARVSCADFDSVLLDIIWENKNIECAYILNRNGIQISNTICFMDKKEVKKNLIFYSAQMGTDHSMERYYYPLVSARLNKYTTEPYISLATGNLCITVSSFFTNVEHNRCILCMDFIAEDTLGTHELIKEIGTTNLVLDINGKSVADVGRIITKMNQEMVKDSLTNTYNRRYIDERLLVDIFNASNQNLPISVIMADLDHFKKVNDTFGHLAGDHVLKEFARIAKKHIRKNSDWIARYGGEEFLIVLVDADEEAAFTVAEKVRQSVEKANIQYKDRNIRITASFGTYTLKSPKMTYEQLIEYADRNLYMAKNSGRNKTIC